jgi:hypothetical protein
VVYWTPILEPPPVLHSPSSHGQTVQTELVLREIAKRGVRHSRADDDLLIDHVTSAGLASGLWALLTLVSRFSSTESAIAINFFTIASPMST